MKRILIKLYTPLIIGICIVFFNACQPKPSSATSNQIQFDTIAMEQAYHLDDNATSPLCSLNISYIVPIGYADADVLKKTQQELNVLFFEDENYENLPVKDAVEQYAKAYIDIYKEQMAMVNHPSKDYFEMPDFRFNKMLKSDITFNRGNLLSYQVMNSNQFMLDSATLYQSRVVNLKTGDFLDEKDIFNAGYEAVFNMTLRDKVVSQFKAKNVGELSDLGFFDPEDITANGNFSIDENGITYIFNEEDIAIRSLGVIRIFLSYDELRPILKENSPISIITN